MGAYSKAIVAAIMAVLIILKTFFGVDLGVTEETVSAIITSVMAVITPLLVYFASNK